jgi:drug/metabolite transporter (DMT)-like permease
LSQALSPWYLVTSRLSVWEVPILWLLAVALVLGSASLHAGWNLIVKSEEDKLFSGWLTVCTPCVLLSPLLLTTGLPAPAAWPFLAASAMVHTGYMIALTRAYQHGDLSIVYPVARGLAPLLVALAAPLALGERLSPVAILAIALVGGGIAALGVSSRRSFAGRAALGWAMATAVFIAGYSVLDKAGVSRTQPLPYIIVLFGVNAILMSPYVLWQGAYRKRVRWGRQVAGGLLSLAAYLLVLMAMRLTQVSYVAALRETSVILAAVLGWRVLGESFGWQRILASAVVAFGGSRVTPGHHAVHPEHSCAGVRSAFAIATADAQQPPRNSPVREISGGTSLRSTRRKPQRSASGWMLVVSRKASSTPRLRARASSASYRRWASPAPRYAGDTASERKSA